jgi:hypothetical protein
MSNKRLVTKSLVSVDGGVMIMMHDSCRANLQHGSNKSAAGGPAGFDAVFGKESDLI